MVSKKKYWAFFLYISIQYITWIIFVNKQIAARLLNRQNTCSPFNLKKSPEISQSINEEKRPLINLIVWLNILFWKKTIYFCQQEMKFY